MTRINSMPMIGSHAQQLQLQQQQQEQNRLEGAVVQKQSSSTSPVPLEVGSIVEVASSSGVTVYGVVRWLGVPAGKTGIWAGLELVGCRRYRPHLSAAPRCQQPPSHLFSLQLFFQDYEVNGCTDGSYGGRRYFTCEGNRALFVPVSKCSPDSRFISGTTGSANAKPTPLPPGETYPPNQHPTGEYSPLLLQA